MGLPYATELARLGDTYAWALEATIEPLVAAVSASSQLPLVAVGSGGSFTAAHLACSLHQHYTGIVSRPLTPLELMSYRLDLRSLSLMILSAGGTNADIASAFADAAQREPRRCSVICLKEGSRLSRFARSFEFVDLLELTPPSAKDGFLATNSLLAFAVLLTRVYGQVFSSPERLPPTYGQLLADGHSGQEYIEQLEGACTSLWERETLLVLYGPSVSPAALDLESKFSEAALGNVQLADFRNFAHGRHNWLAKRGSRTAVLALYSNDDKKLAEKTIRLVPSSIPVARICVPSVFPRASLGALVAVLHLVGAAGRWHGIDPGRPGVPEFGRRLYGLQTPRGTATSGEETAIARKLGCDQRRARDTTGLAIWQDAYRRFVRNLLKARFGALLLDYDGTLCRERDRFFGVSGEIVTALARLLDGGILLGIATGRGDSVRSDLRRVLPGHLWERVHIGYYNGAELASLSDDSHPETSIAPVQRLQILASLLAKHPVIARLATCKLGERQISVRPTSAAAVPLLWRLAQQMGQIHGFVALRSSHSIDLIQQGVSKRLLLEHLQTQLDPETQVLSVGDKGQFPGNDYELLSSPYSLSVDEVSADPDSCWNLAPSGHTGVQATHDYLSWIAERGGSFRVAVPLLTEHRR